MELRQRQKDEDKANNTEVSYPNNVNLGGWLLYFFSPTLVYEVNFPQRKNFRPIYFLCHSLMFLANMFVQYMVVTEDIIPVIRANTNAPLIELYLQL